VSYLHWFILIPFYFFGSLAALAFLIVVCRLLRLKVSINALVGTAIGLSVAGIAVPLACDWVDLVSFRGVLMLALGIVSIVLAAVDAALVSVFVPAAFLPGITGQIFRQFALVIAATSVISAINAMTLKPTQCALYLRTRSSKPPNRLYRGFNRGYEAVKRPYMGLVTRMVRHPGPVFFQHRNPHRVCCAIPKQPLRPLSFYKRASSSSSKRTLKKLEPN